MKLTRNIMLKPIWNRYERALVILAIAAGLTAVLLNFEFNLLEAKLYDLRVAKSAQLEADSGIVLVTLDDPTIQALDAFSPLTLDHHVLFMEQLERLSPRGVGYLVDLNQVNQADPELFNGQWGLRFVRAAERMQSRGIPVILGTNYDVTGEVIPPYPLSALPHALAIVHRDGNVFAEDKVTRRALIELNGKPSLHAELARGAGIFDPEARLAGAFSVPEVDARYFFFRYHGNPASGSYTRVSFLDVLKGGLPKDHFKDKIVLVGTASRDNWVDFGFTPYSRRSFTTPKLAIHANILDSMLHGESVLRLPSAINWAISFASAVFVLWWVLNSTPLYGLFATLLLTLVFIATSQILFQFNGIWVREAQPLLAIFFAYYLAVPYRLIREYKKRWAYQRKNEILTQVEEMKTNFMQLVTHDLKTPVARIQGLAEVLLRKASERLNDRDKETVQSIIHSTEELNRFISSILELQRVESRRIQLQIESKDINRIIETSVEGFKAPARAKQIRIVAQLEPLFPIKIDAGLIAKVMNNLIDNALKYSPEGSTLTVESQEFEGWVVISVSDQGIGMTDEERENLFTRFYRAKNDMTATISGTGLGLYLSKYFVEAHQGRVEVVSTAGAGSTFKIYLPLEEPASPGLTTASSDLVHETVQGSVITLK